MIDAKREDEFVIVANGMLGYGFREQSLHDAIAAGVDLIAADAGSSDPGPYYLGSGHAFVGDEMTKRDLMLLVKAGIDAKVPLIIGSVGGAGSDLHVDKFLTLLQEVVDELGTARKVVVVRSELDRQAVREAVLSQRVQTFETESPLSIEDVDAAERIVAQMGCEAYFPALRESPDIIVGGRAWDVANIAALPLMKGYPRGLTLHLGKILECGSLAARPTGGGDLIMGRLRDDHFIVEPTHPDKVCTVESVSAHTFYEKSDPVRLAGPGGVVDLSDTRFEQLDARRVRVTGSAFQPSTRYTVKLEGAKIAGYRAITIGGVRDANFIAHLDAIQGTVVEKIRHTLEGQVNADSYTIKFHRYGLDGVMGPWEPMKQPSHEVGLLVDVVGKTEAIAQTVCGLARSTLLHVSFPGRLATAGNVAFPFSPAEIPVGPVYEFNVYHLLEIDDPEHFGRMEVLN